MLFFKSIFNSIKCGVYEPIKVSVWDLIQISRIRSCGQIQMSKESFVNRKGDFFPIQTRTSSAKMGTMPRATSSLIYVCTIRAYLSWHTGWPWTRRALTMTNGLQVTRMLPCNHLWPKTLLLGGCIGCSLPLPLVVLRCVQIIFRHFF